MKVRKKTDSLGRETHILNLLAWCQKAQKLRLSPWLVSDKIIPSAILGQMTVPALERKSPLKALAHADLLLAARINLMFLCSLPETMRSCLALTLPKLI